MAQWDDGYVTDVAYTSAFYREITPGWIAMTSLLLGHRPPDLAKPFSYADLGCGNGFTTLVVAATCPHADVWGFDFNPAHVEFASDLAARAGLSNVRFVETSFADLEAMPDGTLPDFDFMVSHGVLSWISPANRRHLVGAVAKRLKPGGLVYLSYNVTTGWTAMVPVQALMRMLAVASPERSDAAVPGVLDFIDRVKQGGALFFQANPAIENRLAEIRKQDPRYIAHEFLNQDWHPLMFAESPARCWRRSAASSAAPRWRRTSTLSRCRRTWRRSWPRRGILLFGRHCGISVAPRRSAGTCIARDCAAAGRRAAGAAGGDDARRDGDGGAEKGGHLRHTDRQRDRSAGGLPAVAGDARGGPLSIRKARGSPAFVGRPLVELMQAFTLLVAGGYAHPMLPDGGTRPGVRRGGV